MEEVTLIRFHGSNAGRKPIALHRCGDSPWDLAQATKLRPSGRPLPSAKLPFTQGYRAPEPFPALLMTFAPLLIQICNP